MTRDSAVRVRALLKQCCQMCGPGQEHACERQTDTPFDIVESPGRLDPIGPLDPQLQARLTQGSGRPLTCTNRVRLLRDGADTFTAMLDLIEGADTEILLENYIIRADALGRAYGEALRQRAKERIDVRILHDPFGDPLSMFSLHWQFGACGNQRPPAEAYAACRLNDSGVRWPYSGTPEAVLSDVRSGSRARV